VKLTFLGTGTSFGVPQIGCGCAVCRSPDPRDRRNRVSALVETDDGAGADHVVEAEALGDRVGVEAVGSGG